MLEGRFTGTMALTEPQAGSSLADVTTRATPREDGAFTIVGAKIFISGGDQSVTENVVHLLLARIDGAPAGTRGISLFVVPRLRPDGERWTDNDVAVSGVIHKIGWKGLPSVALSLGERGDCRGWLIGAPHQGLKCMFQMMNEARLMVGLNGAATASVAFHESLSYAATRPQGRTRSDGPQVPIIEHADVRRMLLRQKAIVEGALALLAETARLSDLSEHAVDPGERERARLVLDVLTPIAKSFPAEWGFESNALAVQVLGGYGYTSEYLPEAFLRDQKLNAIHEGTTGIQGIDLLGRKVLGDGGKALNELGRDITDDIARAREAGVSGALCDALASALARTGGLALKLGVSMSRVGAEAVLAQASHFMQLASILVVSWQWLVMATAAERGRVSRPADATFYEGKLAAARYFIETELSRVDALAVLCEDPSPAFLEVSPDALD
jgi:alkylation response protein AidB-like acyl-CoA dehydrogenase